MEQPTKVCQWCSKPIDGNPKRKYCEDKECKQSRGRDKWHAHRRKESYDGHA